MVTKKDLIATTATAIGITQKDCAAVIDAFLGAVETAVVESKDDVSLGDLGKFKVVETKAKAARTMTSGLTGKEVVIPAKDAGTKVIFKLSKKIKDGTTK